MQKFLQPIFQQTGSKTRKEILRRLARVTRPTVLRKLRSCCLELRADDGRLRRYFERSEVRRPKSEDRRQKTEGRNQKTEDRRQKTEDREQKPENGLQLKVTADIVRQLHKPVKIPKKGFTIREAANAFGVSRPTINRWIKEGLLSLCQGDSKNRRVFPPIPKARKPADEPLQALLDEVEKFAGPRGRRSSGRPKDICRIHFDMPEPELPKEFEQTLEVVQRRVHKNVRRYYFLCPRCQGTCEKVFLYVPIRTIFGEVFSREGQRNKGTEAQSGVTTEARKQGQAVASACGVAPVERRFICRQCLGLRYESEERKEKGSNILRRWFLRMTGGLFTEREFFEFALRG